MRERESSESSDEALRRVASRFGQALRAAKAGAWEWNVGTNQAFWSDENYELMGLDPAASDASYGRWLACIHPEDRAQAEWAVQRAVDEGRDLDIEFRVVLPGGGIRWLRDVGKMVTDADGSPIAMYGIQIDVTERHAAQQARMRAEDQLRRAQRLEAVGTLAGGVAHDFNNLLTVMLSAAESLRHRLPQLEGSREIEDIRDAARRASALTRQLLSFSRRQETKPRPVDLNGLIEQMLPIAQRVVREDVELELHLAPGLPAVHADPAQLDQVLMNLVLNARDAMPGGGTLTIETQPGEGGHVLLVVQDTGVGMDEETVARVFDPFFTTKGATRGSGLGLASVYGIVSQAGGSVDVESSPGNGASFRVSLPATDLPPAPTVIANTKPAPAPGGAVVLLVEDDDAVRRAARRVLESGGYTVLEASDADRATKIAREHGAPIDLLLTDVVMPGASGAELAERLLRDRRGLRILFMSGHAGDELSRRGVGDSARLVEKPFSAATLLEAVQRALD